MILTFAKCFEDKGIFSLFNEIDSGFISEILPDEDLTIFDDYSVFTIGNYPIFNTSFTPEKLARFCLIKNKTAWKKFNDSLIAEFNLSGKTTTENNTTNVDSDRTNNLKVNGYDDSQLVTDTETTDNSDIEQTETKTRVETRENPSEVIERNIITQKNNKLVDMIVSDIKNTICLDSLDSCTINDDYSGGGSVTIDDSLSTVSENPVQNKVITQKINQVENSIPDVSGLATKSELQAVENSIPDVSGLATQSSVNAISELIPQNASTSNKLATIADISGGGSSEITISETPEYLNEKVIKANTTYKKYKVLLDLGTNRQIIQNGVYYWSAWKSSLTPTDTSFFFGKIKDFLTNNSVYAVLNIRLYDQSFTHYFDIPYVKIDKTNKEIKYMVLPKTDFSTAPTNIFPSGTTASDFGTQAMRYIEVTYLVEDTQ